MAARKRATPAAEDLGYFVTHRNRIAYPEERKGSVGFRRAQLAASHAISAHFFSSNDPAIVTMPTGSGKTAVMMLATFALTPRRVLVITPSRLVRDQIADGFEQLSLFRSLGALPPDVPGPRVTRVEAMLGGARDWKRLRSSDVIVGTVQSSSPAMKSVASPPDDLFDLLLVDEAHHSPARTWKALLDAFPKAHRVLFTATPFRRDERHIHGRFVFTYDLRRARSDGVFGQLEYEPVIPRSTATADVELAQAAEAKLRADRAAGLNHRLMVRTATRARAQQLAKIYTEDTTLKLEALLAKHSLRHARSVIRRVKDGDLDGLICVDMLGEGFDLPHLKIAALHSPHRSLAVTLQFIGRFARTTATDVGRATFLAIPSEIEIEAQQLYVPGAEWNELVADAASKKIQQQKELREFLDTFESTAALGPESISLYALTPYFHVKVLRTSSTVDLRREIAPPGGADVVLDTMGAGESMRVLVTREINPVLWSREGDVANVQFDLYVLIHLKSDGLLFICSSRRDTETYDSLGAAVTDEQPALLPPDVLNRVLGMLRKPEFFSIGMRNRAAFGHSESYRMITGPAADRAIQKSDGRFYHRGHWFGRGTSPDGSATLGASSSSKVWSNRRSPLPELLGWCKALAKCIASSAATVTGSGLDHLSVGKGINSLPLDITAAALPERAYKGSGLLVQFPVVERDRTEAALVDCDLVVRGRAGNVQQFALVFSTGTIELEFSLNPTPHWEITSHTSEDVIVVDPDGRAATPLVDFFGEDPPTFYTASLASISGSILYEGPTTDEPFDSTRIEAVDWAGVSVDPMFEKPPASTGNRSLFEFIEARLLGTSANVVVCDDGTGEVADFIALFDGGRSTRVEMYHCKAATRTPVPGSRVGDLYEVIGQTVKSVRWTGARKIRDRLRHRRENTLGCKFKRGDATLLDSLLADGREVNFEIVVVLPTIGASPNAAFLELLAATNAHLVAGRVAPLRVIGSR